MPRIRSIKPEFFVSEQVAECSPIARLLFIGLWVFADDYGNHPARPKQLKIEVFPGDSMAESDVCQLMAELIGAGLVVEYFGEDGARYWHITGWHHQKIDKPTAPKYPTIGSNIVDQAESIRRLIDERSTSVRRLIDERSTSVRRLIDEHSTTDRRAFDERSIRIGEDRIGEERKGEDGRGGERGGEVPCSEDFANEVSEPPIRAEPLTGYSFEVSGGAGVWTLPQKFYNRLRESYPAVDLDDQLRQAQAWCAAAGNRRKTTSGMPQFLNRWMAKEQNAAGRAPPRPLSSRNQANNDQAEAFLQSIREGSCRETGA